MSILLSLLLLLLGLFLSSSVISLIASFVMGFNVSVFKVMLIVFILHLLPALIVLFIGGPVFLIDKCLSIFKRDKKNKQRKEL